MSDYSTRWTVMNDLEDSFSRISTIEFLSDKLVEAVDSDNRLDVVDIANALLAFIPVYTRDYDEKFQKAWKITIGEEYQKNPSKFSEEVLKYKLENPDINDL